ncbi:inositol monophosphatase family protein [Georgenia sp.]
MTNSQKVDLQVALADALAAAAAGASKLRQFVPDLVRSEIKGEIGNLVSDADVAAERAIRQVLSRRRPDDAVTGEELEAKSGGGRLRWSIDPLDGTTNFLRGLPFYCTSVAAYDIIEGAWVVGAIEAPALQRRYWATRGGGAWREMVGEVLQLHGPEACGIAALLCTGLSYSTRIRATQIATLPALMEGFSDLRRLGSAALELCLVADGSLDGFVEGDLAEHDWAAGALIAHEAGLAVVLPEVPGGIVAATMKA